MLTPLDISKRLLLGDGRVFAPGCLSPLLFKFKEPAELFQCHAGFWMSFTLSFWECLAPGVTLGCYPVPMSFSPRKEKVSSQLGVKDASHALQQCAKRQSKVRAEQRKANCRKMEGKTKWCYISCLDWASNLFPVSLGSQYTCIPTASHF